MKIDITLKGIDEQVWQEAKIAAIRAGKTLRDWVVDVIQEKVKD